MRVYRISIAHSECLFVFYLNWVYVYRNQASIFTEISTLYRNKRA